MTDPTDDTELSRSRAETRAAFENRALMYHYILEELAAEVGRERAIAIMKRAIRGRGEVVGRKYAPAAAEGDLETVGTLFCASSPAGGTLFSPGIEEPAAGGRIVLRMETCPLVDAWRALGLPPDEVDALCEISAAVDEGTFEGAGLELEFLDRLGSPDGMRCLLELRLPGAASEEAPG
jgi:hypothetical protein